MVSGTGHLIGFVLVVLLTISVVPDAAVAADGGARRPLPASDYSVRPVCGAPLPGRASCLAFGLVPKTVAARAHSHPLGMTLPGGIQAAGSAAAGAYGLRPSDLHSAYELPVSAPSAQTIALVDAFDDPTAEGDLRVYDEEFGLPPCTAADHCFRKVNQQGDPSPLPETDDGWAIEISLDIETAHAICQSCHILLVEADSSYTTDLESAEQTAAAEGATEISNSYGGSDQPPGYSYDHPGVVITASTGDWGYDNWVSPFYGESANSPASSPDVIAVGGTRLSMVDDAWAGETAWYEGGSGCGGFASAPAWQSSVPNWGQVGCGSNRATADVAADADPYTGVAVYDSTPDPPYFPGWATFGGTSLSSPIIAAAFALAGGSHGVEYPAQTLYSHLGSSSLHDVVSGTNWGCSKIGESGYRECTLAEEEANCSNLAICNAGPGYDGPTGVGTPDGLAALDASPSGPPPTVTAVVPDEGTTAGGTTVTISGTNLNEALFVRFDNARATIVADSEESITVETPGHEPGVVDVTVTSSGGVRSSATSADRYTYVVPQPSVTAVDPDHGPAEGGTTVTIGGSNLGEAEYVEFGDSYAPILAATEASITTISPPHEPGGVEVTVVGPYEVTSSESASDRYTYLLPPAPPSAALSIARAGSGEGWVFSSPPGIACDSACSYSFAEGTEVTLMADPAAGSSFGGWSGGGCSGTGICEMWLGSNTTVTASFDATEPKGGPEVSLAPGGTLPIGPASAGPPRVTREGGSADPYGKCLAAARRAYLRFKRATLRRRGKARSRALKRARRREAEQVVSCRRRFARAAERQSRTANALSNGGLEAEEGKLLGMAS
jgi:hypothetical protein